MTPPAFQQFFDGPWMEALRAVEIPGAPTASWDRKAAWLLWLATDEGRQPLPVPPPKQEDVFS